MLIIFICFLNPTLSNGFSTHKKLIICLNVSNATNIKKNISINNIFTSYYFKHTADTNLLKMVPVEILLNFGNYFRTLQLGFKKFLSGIVFLHYQVRTIGLFFLQAHSIWPKPRAFNPDKKSIGTPKFYCEHLKWKLFFKLCFRFIKDLDSWILYFHYIYISILENIYESLSYYYSYKKIC